MQRHWRVFCGEDAASATKCGHYGSFTVTCGRNKNGWYVCGVDEYLPTLDKWHDWMKWMNMKWDRKTST